MVCLSSRCVQLDSKLRGEEQVASADKVEFVARYDRMLERVRARWTAAANQLQPEA